MASPQCCSELLAELAAPLQLTGDSVCNPHTFPISPINVSSSNPVVRVPSLESALVPFTTHTNVSAGVFYPLRVWSVFVDQDTACKFMALRVRIRLSAGLAEVFVSKRVLVPLSFFASSFYPTSAAPAWRGSFKGPGDDVDVLACLDDPNAGPGTYFVEVLCESVRCHYDLDVMLVEHDATFLQQAPVLPPPPAACVAPACVPLSDGVSSAMQLSARIPRFAAFLIGEPQLVHFVISRDWNQSVSVTVGATISPDDPLVQFPMWKETSFATSHRFALSFLDSSSTHNLTFPLRVSLRIEARGVGLVHLLATSHARFSVVPIQTIPPLPARSRLIGTSYLQSVDDGVTHYCQPLSATQPPTPTATIGDYCDARYWAFSPSDPDSANPMILSSMDTIESSTTYVPFDYTPPVFLDQRTALSSSYTSFWLIFWWPIDQSFVQVFPPGRLFSSPARVRMSNRLVSLGGYLPANPTESWSYADSLFSQSCDGFRYRENLNLTLDVVRPLVTPPIHEQYTVDFVPVISQLGNDPSAGRTTPFSIAMFSDWYTSCTGFMDSVFMEGSVSEAQVFGKACTMVVDDTGATFPNTSDPCCVAELQYNTPCDLEIRRMPMLQAHFRADPMLNSTQCPTLTANADCYEQAVSYPAQAIDDRPTHCASDFCSGNSVYAASTALNEFVNANILGGGCQNGLASGFQRITEVSRTHCSTDIFGTSPILGPECSSDEDCLLIFSHASDTVTCDLFRRRCRTSDTDALNEFLICLSQNVSPLTFTLILRGLGLPEEGQTPPEILEWLAGPSSPLWNPLKCTFTSADGRIEHVPVLGSILFGYDRSCIDELSIDRSPSYASIALFNRESPPYLPNPLYARRPADVCPEIQFSTLGSSCLPNEHQICNWHACIGCDPTEAAAFCLNAPFNEPSCPAWTNSQSSPVSSSREGCFVCHVDRCTFLPQFSALEACADSPVCEYQNGRFDLCPPTDSSSDTSWCSQPCPGSSCSSARFGISGVCLAEQLSQSDCAILHGVWMGDFALCRFHLARSANECPSPYLWLQCSSLSTAQCDSLPAAHQAVAQCFVDNWRPCSTEGECLSLGGRCANESTSSYSFSLPPALQTGIPYLVELFSDPIFLATAPSQFQNFYHFPPVWGACIFSTIGTDLLTLDVSRYCTQFPNTSSSTLPRVTIPSGCIDLSVLNHTACTALGGRWQTPAQSQQACLGAFGNEQVCIGELLGQRTNYSETECVQSAVRNYFPAAVWLPGRWVKPQPRQAHWLTRSYAAPRNTTGRADLQLIPYVFDIVGNAYFQRTIRSFQTCLFGSVLTGISRSVCDCTTNSSTEECFIDQVFNDASFSVCTNDPSSFALSPVIISVTSFPAYDLPDLPVILCVGLNITIVDATHYFAPPSFSGSGILSNQPQTIPEALHAVHNANNRKVGYILGDGIMLHIVPPGGIHNASVPLTLDILANISLCFKLNQYFLSNFEFYPPDTFLALGDGYQPDLAFAMPDGTLHPSNSHHDSSIAPNQTGFLCFSQVRLPAVDTLVIFPAISEIDWTVGNDPDALDSLAVGFYSALSGMYGFLCITALVCLIVFLPIQKSPFNPTHAVITGLALFLLIRCIYFALLATETTDSIHPVVDFGLIQFPQFLLAATFVIMLCYWHHRQHEASSRFSPLVVIVMMDCFLLAVFVLFMLLFGLLPSTHLTDPHLCIPPSAIRSLGSQRSAAQSSIQIASQSFIVATCLTMSALFALNSIRFIKSLTAAQASSLLKVVRASKISDSSELRAKFFQTTLMLSFFFAADSLFLLIFYLFTSFHESFWAAIVLFCIEVFPISFILYQTHPKLTLIALYGRSHGPQQLPDHISARESIDQGDKTLFTSENW